MSHLDEMFMAKQRDDESLKRNHESYEVEIEYQDKTDELPIEIEETL